MADLLFDPYRIYLWLVVVSGALSVTVAVIAWRNRDVDGAVPLAVLAAALVWWAGAKALELVATSPAATRVFTDAQYLGITAVPATWLVFALVYSGRREWVRRRTLAALAVEPLVVLLLIATNDGHGLFRTTSAVVPHGPYSALVSSVGPAFWAHTVYSYLLLGVGTLSIVRTALTADHLFRGQSVALLVAVAIPWVANGVSLAGVAPGSMDLTIIAFAGSGLILLVATGRHQLLTVSPAARELARAELVEGMSDAVIVLDPHDRVVYLNPAAKRIIGTSTRNAIGRPLRAVFSSLADALEGSSATEDGGTRTTLTTTAQDSYHHYDVRVSSLGRARIVGRLVSLRDVTVRQQREQRLDVMNRLIRHNIRNQLSTIMGSASVIAEAVEDEELERWMQAIDAAAERLLDRAEKATSLAERVPWSVPGPTDVAAEVDQLIGRMRRAHPDAQITFDSPESVMADVGPAITSAVEELLTNALEHTGTSPAIHVAIVPDSPAEGRGVQIRVTDPGPGIPEEEITPILRGGETPLSHATGVGLWVATWIVREAGGDLRFEEDEGRSSVTIHLPAAERDAAS